MYFRDSRDIRPPAKRDEWTGKKLLFEEQKTKKTVIGVTRGITQKVWFTSKR